MITYEWDHADLSYIQRKLGDMRAQAPRAMRDAVNNTAKTARMKLLKAAQERYTIKSGRFKSKAEITYATLANPTALIKFRGKPPTVTSFHATAPKSGGKAEVLSGSGLKMLVGPKRLKAFMAKKVMFQRVGKERLPLKKISGPSVPKQIEMVYGGKNLSRTPVKEEINKLLQANVEKQIKRFLQ